MTEDLIAQRTAQNSSFSRNLPGLQLGIDSTSLGTFKECPRKYFYSIVLGYQSRHESVHLRFGLELHSAVERYHRKKAEGASHADALDYTLDVALRSTWEPRLGRPWASDHAQKNRISLLRTIVWYLDKFGQEEGAPTITLASGAPAVELSFRFDSGISVMGEQILFCGHLDRIADVGGRLFVSDIKTTVSQLTPRWFESFSPGNQFSMYTLAGKIAFAEPVNGVIVDGVQVGVEFSRFGRQLAHRPEAVMAEWHLDASWWVGRMAQAADEQHWPMNDKSCSMYGGCPFQSVCSRHPGQRDAVLRAEFTKRIWDPLQVRGDI